MGPKSNFGAPRRSLQYVPVAERRTRRKPISEALVTRAQAVSDQDTPNAPLRSLLGNNCVLTHVPAVMGFEDAYLLMGANPNIMLLAKPR
jgi:hypothetical protein